MVSILNSFKKNYQIILGLVFSVLVVSCGTYQNSTYGDDGIYEGTAINNNRTPQNTQQNTNTQAVPSGTSESYFSKKIAEYEQYNQEGDVLTDIEGYSSNAQHYNDQQPIEYYDQPEWGANAQTNAQVYANFGWGWNNGWNNYYPFWNRGFRNSWGWGWNDPFFYGGGAYAGFYGRPYWGNNFWYGNRWGWNNGWYGNRWGWNNGYYRRSIAVNNNSRRYYNGRANTTSQRVYSRNSSTRNSSVRSTNGRTTRTYSPRQSTTTNRSARSSNSSNSSGTYRRNNSSSNNRSYSPRSSSSSRSYRGSGSSSRSSRSSGSSRGGSYRRR